MEGVAFNLGPAEFAVVSGIVGVLFKALLNSKDSQIASEREDKLTYRAALLRNLGTSSRATSAAEKATVALAKEKGIEFDE